MLARLEEMKLEGINSHNILLELINVNIYVGDLLADAVISKIPPQLYHHPSKIIIIITYLRDINQLFRPLWTYSQGC